MHIDKVRLAQAISALWVLIALILHNDVYEELLVGEGGLLFRLVAVIIIAWPVWCIYGWEWLAKNQKPPRVVWAAIAITGIVFFLWLGNLDNYIRGDRLTVLAWFSGIVYIILLIIVYSWDALIFNVKSDCKKLTSKNSNPLPPEIRDIFDSMLGVESNSTQAEKVKSLQDLTNKVMSLLDVTISLKCEIDKYLKFKYKKPKIDSHPLLIAFECSLFTLAYSLTLAAANQNLNSAPTQHKIMLTSGYIAKSIDYFIAIPFFLMPKEDQNRMPDLLKNLITNPESRKAAQQILTSNLLDSDIKYFNSLYLDDVANFSSFYIKNGAYLTFINKTVNDKINKDDDFESHLSALFSNHLKQVSSILS